MPSVRATEEREEILTIAAVTTRIASAIPYLRCCT